MILYKHNYVPIIYKLFFERREVNEENIILNYLYEPFEEPEAESEVPEGCYEFSAVELSPHINIIMGPIKKEKVKYIAIEMVGDEKEKSTFLVANRIDHFNRFTALDSGAVKPVLQLFP